jgi:ribosome-associated toxin RatA of RatAB toxin-antitoxin module
LGRIRVKQVVCAPPEAVAALARDINLYPSFMPSLRRIELLETDADGLGGRTRWHAEHRVFAARRAMSWVQRERWDPGGLCCRFELDPSEPGRYKKLKGRWLFNPHPDGAELIVDIDFLLDHPALNPAIHRVLDMLMERNNRALLKAMKHAAETSCVQPRPQI